MRPGQGAGAGVGGIGRGPGHVRLGSDGDSQGGVAKAMPLPPGQAPPEDWVPIGARRTTPEVAPVRPTGAGAGGDAGSAAASWQLDIAPRHRRVVQRFFEREDRR